MSLDLEQLIKSARQVKMSDQNKRQLHDDMLAFVSAHPIKKQPAWVMVWINIKEVVALKPLAVNFKYAALIIILLSVSAGGMSWAAEGAVPGDILYPVKVNINETARVALAMNSQKKAEISAWQAARRLDEAEQLVVAGKLDNSKREELEMRFENHVAKFEESKNELNGTPPGLLKISTNSNFEGVLKGHAQVLTNLSIDDNDDNKEVSPFLVKVQARIAQVEQNREQGENNLSNGSESLESPAKGQIGAAKNKLRETQNYINRARISSENKTAALAQLQLAQTSLTEAETALNQGLFVEAITKAQASMRLSQQAKQQASSSEKLKINWQSNSDNKDDDDDSDDNNDNNNSSDDDDEEEDDRENSSTTSGRPGRSNNSVKLEVNAELDID